MGPACLVGRLHHDRQSDLLGGLRGLLGRGHGAECRDGHAAFDPAPPLVGLVAGDPDGVRIRAGQAELAGHLGGLNHLVLGDREQCVERLRRVDLLDRRQQRRQLMGLAVNDLVDAGAEYLRTAGRRVVAIQPAAEEGDVQTQLPRRP
jgi:hypothetical protein